MLLCIFSEQDNVLLSQENPPLCFVNLILPVITQLVLCLSKTKFTKCLAIRTNKRHTNIAHLLCFIFRRESWIFVFLYMFSLSLSLSHSFSSACPQGTFKSFQGAGLCQQCPLNSRSTIEAATLCGCRNGYYRGDMDKPEDMCTSESVFLCHNQTRKKKKDIFSKPSSHVAVSDYASGWFKQVCEGKFFGPMLPIEEKIAAHQWLILVTI